MNGIFFGPLALPAPNHTVLFRRMSLQANKVPVRAAREREAFSCHRLRFILLLVNPADLALMIAKRTEVRMVCECN